MNELKLALWNANGLSQHKLEVQKFIIEQNIDIMLISETHFTEKNYLKFNGYKLYDTKHPSGKGHGGTAILIKNRIKHHELQNYCKDHIQATSICLEEWNSKCNISAVYCPPKHAIKKEDFKHFFDTLGEKFIAGGDYNSKHTFWGSRLVSTKGKQLLETINEKNLDSVSTGHPTYWPTDRQKTPDLLDFFIVKGVPRSYMKSDVCYDLSSDHSPVLLTLCTESLKIEDPTHLTNRKTKWPLYRKILEQSSEMKFALKSAEDIDRTAELINKVMKEAAVKSTPNHISSDRKSNISPSIQQLLQEKRNLRRQWQHFRSPTTKYKLNRAIKNLKDALISERDNGIQKYLEELSPTVNTDYSLWKATKKIKRPQVQYPPIRLNNGDWARSDSEKAETFAKHLEEVFTPSIQSNSHELPELLVNNKTQRIKFTFKSVKQIISDKINPKKAAGVDLITGKMLRELPDKFIKVLTYLFNAIMRLEYYPQNWKISQIIMIPKPGKDSTQAASYRPISLLPILSKLFEKLLAEKLKPHLDDILPKFQFGFREEHGTVEQVHRIVSEIKQALDTRKYCSAAFLDIAQAFDKVWHEGLIHKIKATLPYCFHNILTNYLSDRKFFVKYESAATSLYNIRSGVPQGSVLGPILYLIFTADIPTPTSESVVLSTFADDTAILSTNKNPQTASRELQDYLQQFEEYLKKWNIKTNETKSTHITFTLNKLTCPSVKLNNKILPQHREVKYLGLHLDRRLTWKKHVETKRQQMKLKFGQLYWLINPHSKLSLDCKVLLYKAIIKPIWTYGIQIWGSTSSTNIDIIQRSQSKMLRKIVNAPWYIRNSNIHSDLNIKYIKDVIKEMSIKYQLKLETHPNELARGILTKPKYQRLQRKDPLDLIY